MKLKIFNKITLESEMMREYEYLDDGGRALCKFHHRLRCDECFYVDELEKQNKHYRKVIKEALAYAKSPKILTNPSEIEKILAKALENKGNEEKV